MPRNPTTGIYTRPTNSFAQPVFDEIIDEIGANETFDDWDDQITKCMPEEPVVVTGATAIVAAGTTSVAINKAAPATTGLTLPTVADQNGVLLMIADWSTAVVSHVITLTPAGGETIARQATWTLQSNASFLARAVLYPSTTLSGWMVLD